jgi:polyhydroxyalkanoate synthesis repressor PhaR
MIVKKYANRRLYDTSRSAYINLEELAQLVRDGHEVTVQDARTGEDLTREVLLQVVLEVHRGVDFFPVGMLRRIIRASGDRPEQLRLREQLSAGLQMMSAQLDRMEAFFAGPAQRAAARPSSPEPAPERARDGEPDQELAAMRARLAALEARLGNPQG